MRAAFKEYAEGGVLKLVNFLKMCEFQGLLRPQVLGAIFEPLLATATWSHPPPLGARIAASAG